jgi:hypothetical protein
MANGLAYFGLLPFQNLKSFRGFATGLDIQLLDRDKRSSLLWFKAISEFKKSFRCFAIAFDIQLLDRGKRSSLFWFMAISEFKKVLGDLPLVLTSNYLIGANGLAYSGLWPFQNSKSFRCFAIAFDIQLLDRGKRSSLFWFMAISEFKKLWVFCHSV